MDWRCVSERGESAGEGGGSKRVHDERKGGGRSKGVRGGWERRDYFPMMVYGRYGVLVAPREGSRL